MGWPTPAGPRTNGDPVTTTDPNAVTVSKTSEPTTAPTTMATFGTAFADPAGLGLTAFAATTFFLSAVNAGWIPDTVEPVVLGLALFYGGITQLLAGMWEFVKGNSFGAVAFSSYGAFWLSFWYLVAHTDLSKAGADVNKGVGFYLVIWTIVTAYLFIASMRTNTVVMGVFGLLTLTFLFLALGEFGKDLAGAGLTRIGGYLGLLTAIVAWYGSFATVTNYTFKRVVLPVGPRA
jgi:succinate-acetate transporter protein